MQADVQTYKPYEQHFQLHILHSGVPTKHLASSVERHCIKVFSATDPEKGYTGHPYNDRKFWGMKKGNRNIRDGNV